MSGVKFADGTLVYKRNNLIHIFFCMQTIKTKNLDSLRDALEQYRSEGYDFQRRYREIVDIDPSSASLMLSEDFNVSVWSKIVKKIKNK